MKDGVSASVARAAAAANGSLFAGLAVMVTTERVVCTIFDMGAQAQGASRQGSRGFFWRLVPQ